MTTTPATAAEWQPPRWMMATSRAVIATITALAALAIVLALMAALPGTRTGLVTVVGMLAGIWVGSIVVHELGHWAAAALAGMTTTRFDVLWLKAERRRDGWSVALQRKPRFLDGFHLAYPDDRRSLRRQLAWHGLGGGLANLASAFAAVAAIRISASPVLDVALFMFAVWSVALGVASLLPSNARAENDGYHLLRLWRMPMSRADETMLRIAGAFARGVSESELDSGEITALAQGSPEHRASAAAIVVVAALQREDLVAAVAHVAALEAALDALPVPRDDWRMYARTARLVGNAVDAPMAEWLAAPIDERQHWEAALRHSAHGRWPDCEAALEPMLRAARRDFFANTLVTTEAIARLVTRHARAATPAGSVLALG